MMKLFLGDLKARIARRYTKNSSILCPIASLFISLALTLSLTAATRPWNRLRDNRLPRSAEQVTDNLRKDPTNAERAHSAGFGRRTHPGWLFVLDWNETTFEGSVLLVDPAKGRVVATIKAGRNLDAALSPDGTQLYVAFTRYNPDGRGRKDFLEVVNTKSGAIVKTVNNPDRWISTGPHYAPTMAFSPDGRSLYVFKHGQEGNVDTYYLATFDTVERKFLPAKVMVPDCVAATLVPLAKPEGLTVICSGTTDLRFLQLSENGGVVRPAGSAMSASNRLSLWSKGVMEHGRRIGPGFLSPDGRTLTVLMGDGRLFKIDNETRVIRQTDAVDAEARGVTISQATTSNPSSTSGDDWLCGKWIRYQSSELSADGHTMYMGVGWLAHLGQGVQEFTEVVILDSQKLSRMGTIKTSYPFASFAVSKYDRRLYAISPEQGCIMVIDTDSQREIRTIYGIGTSPFRAIVAH